MTIVEIQKLVCQTYGISRAEMLSRGRRHIEPRQVAMWITRETTHHSLPAIGGKFGPRDHVTVMYGVAQIERRRLADQAFAAQLGHLELAVAKHDLAREIAEARAEMRAAA